MGISSSIMRVQYLALTIFSNRGGIEQVSKNWLYTLNNLKDNYISKISVLYDNSSDDNYISSNKFTGYSGNKFGFILKSVFIGTQSEINIFSHIHLSIVALLIKLLHPSSKIIFQLHGIEVWRELSYLQKKALTICSQIICVSEFTKNKLLINYPELTNKTIVINNSLDPYALKAYESKLREDFRSQLSFKHDDKLLIAVGRLNYYEAYKGYDKVIESLYNINNPKIHYHVIGKYDADDLYSSNDIVSKVVQQFTQSNADALYGDLKYVLKNDITRTIRFWISGEYSDGKFYTDGCLLIRPSL
jgi:phosphatidylinositol alpha-1,6-mannosyltransferase